jgi:YlmC/YmxH family sporulation protein
VIKISDLQTKDVVNIHDGKKLGHVNDLELDLERGRVEAIVVPASTKVFSLFGGEEYVIPWRNIVKIGSDVILVRLQGIPSNHDVYDPEEKLYQRSVITAKHGHKD